MTAATPTHAPKARLVAMASFRVTTTTRHRASTSAKQHHLRAMGAQVLGGGVSSVIYLMGDATPRQPGEITFMEQAE